MTRKEKKLISIAGIILAVFTLFKVIPSTRNFFKKQEQAIEEVKIKKRRFEKLERRTDFWEKEYKNLRKVSRKIYKASLVGDTPELISANIQSILKTQAKKAGIRFKSMELGESAVVGEWVLVTQAMRFEAESESFFNFLNALRKSKSELIITDLDIRSHNNRITGKIKVAGFSHPPLKEVKPEKTQIPPVENQTPLIEEANKSAVIEGESPENVDNQALPSESPENVDNQALPSESPENVDNQALPSELPENVDNQALPQESETEEIPDNPDNVEQTAPVGPF